MRRTREITFRLAPPSQANSVEVVLSNAEYGAVERAAKGEPLGPFVRGLVTAAVAPVDAETAYRAAREHADQSGLTLGVWLRLVVLTSIGELDSLGEAVTRARAWLAKR